MTLGAPSGAFGGSNGDQSGTESRMSVLILPLNGRLMRSPWKRCWSRAAADPPPSGGRCLLSAARDAPRGAAPGTAGDPAGSEHAVTSYVLPSFGFHRAERSKTVAQSFLMLTTVQS